MLLLYPCLHAGAQQNYVFHHLASKDGLASDYAISFFQDSKGFYWIGTSAGLQKFDGYSFSKPLRVGQDLLPYSTVTETSDGTLWISNENDLLKYDRVNDHFESVAPTADTIKSLQVFEDKQGQIWAINHQALYRFNVNKEKFNLWLTFPKIAGPVPALPIAFDKASGTFWMEKGALLYKVTVLNKTISQDSMRPMPASIWMDGEQFLWLSFWGGYLCRYDMIKGGKEWFTMPYKNKGSSIVNLAVASCFKRDEIGRLWIGCYGGLWY